MQPDATLIDVFVRWMIRSDLATVLAIEAESFEFPWSEQDLIRCLRQKTCIGKVVEHKDRVVGFMVYDLQKARIDVLNLAVAATHRRLGVGTLMVAELILKLSRPGRRSIRCNVRESNLAAQLFFRAAGFRAMRVIRCPYHDTTEDAYRFFYHLPPRDDCQQGDSRKKDSSR